MEELSSIALDSAGDAFISGISFSSDYPTTAAAFQKIGRACLAHYLRNERILRERRTIESVHQARVGVRRLRAAMTLFKDLLQELAAQGKAILYISHVLEVVEQVCDRVIVIAKGKILADAAPAELAKVMQLANLQDVFAQLVQQEDTRVLARQLVDVMGVRDA